MRYVPARDKAFKKASQRPCSELQQAARSHNFEFGRFVRDTKWVLALASDLRYKHLKYSMSCTAEQSSLLHKAWMQAVQLQVTMEEIKNCMQGMQAEDRALLKKLLDSHKCELPVLQGKE